MPKILTKPVGPLKCELPADRHTRKLPFARAINLATYGRTSAIAGRLGSSASLLAAWKDPERENVPPSQRLAELMLAAVAEGVDPYDALEPLRHLNEVFGFEATPVLPVAGTIGVEHALGTTIKEAADVAAALVESLPNGITPFEAARSKCEIRQLRASIDSLELSLDVAVSRKAAEPQG